MYERKYWNSYEKNLHLLLLSVRYHKPRKKKEKKKKIKKKKIKKKRDKKNASSLIIKKMQEM